MILTAILSRGVGSRVLEAQAVAADALDRKFLTLKSGGRTLWLNAEEVIWAKAAGNYVEIRTAGACHLVRLTLVALEALLAAAGCGHVRIHRSAIVKRSAIREIVPTRTGDVTVVLRTGEIFKGSRRYRDNVET